MTDVMTIDMTVDMTDVTTTSKKLMTVVTSPNIFLNLQNSFQQPSTAAAASIDKL